MPMFLETMETLIDAKKIVVSAINNKTFNSSIFRFLKMNSLIYMISR